MKSIFLLFVLALLSLALTACDNTQSNTPESEEKGDLENKADNSDSGSPQEPGTCTELTLDLHDGTGQALVKLANMTITTEDIESYDFAMVNQMPEPPAIYLGPLAQAVDLGSGMSFMDVVEAPLNGYANDSDESVIGTGWRTGGSGQQGHEMSGNVYVLKLGDNIYGKIRVTSAKQGVVTIDAFHQDDGSADLECAFKE